MPNIAQTELYPQKSWDEFEDIVWDLYSRVWGDPDAQRYGRMGQAQQGVDIYGRPSDLGGRYVGVQCRRYGEGRLTRTVIEEEVAKVEGFEPPLAEYIIATTGHRNTELQAGVRKIDEARRAAGRFGVRIVFWEDLCSLLAHPDNRDLLQKHYGEWLEIVRQTPFTAPPDLATFTGREKLLKELDGLLEPGGTASVAIVGLKGMAGVGKSALAVHAAHRWRERFPDGVAWVDLRAERGACDALRHVAGLYGYREEAAKLGEDRQALTGLVRTVLQGKQALLILDNAEGLGAEELACLLPGVAGPVTVVTSRREFAALGRLGKRLRVDVMAEGEALALLGRLVGAEQVERDREAFAKLAERLGWLPLALDIAGRRMAEQGWGPGEMVRRLEGARDRPSFLALPVAERSEESVALAFALSYEGLGEKERELFRALGAFAPAGFTARAVAGVWGGEEREERIENRGKEEVEGALEWLEALSLVRRAAKEGAQAEFVEGAWPARPERSRGELAEGRYDLHPLVRDYAQALAEKEGERERWAERHARYFAALAAVAAATAERGNLLAAQEASVRLGMWDGAVSLAYRLDDLFERSGHWAGRRRALERGIEAAREGGDRRRAAHLAIRLGEAYRQTGEYADARQQYEAAMRGLEGIGEDSSVEYAMAIHDSAIVAQAQGDYREARRLYQESLDIKQQLGDHAGVAISLQQLGMLAQAQGDYREARRLYQESLDIKQQLGDRAGVAISLHQPGMLALAQGDYREARRLYQESLHIARQLGDRAGVAISLHQLGMLAQAQGDYPEARRLYQESLHIARQLGDRAGVAISLHQLGRLAQAQGDYPEARRLYQESLDIKQQLGNRAGVARSLHQLGRLAEGDGDLEEAERLFAESLGTFEELRSPDAEIARGSLERVRKGTR
jgi:tetratricopeptide (TPR) repeat protein